ncbi:MAG: hypothetical protein M5U27_10190 [Gaiella sp.]|nr:hypothetical protein [Gaiella sp.]
MPRAVVRAMRSGLSRDDFAIITALYDRADLAALRRRSETPSLTLAQIAEVIRWTGTLDALSRRLRRLSARPERWFTYRIEGGRGRYVFTLNPDAAGLSDLCPSSQANECPTSDDSATRMDSGIAATATRSVSDRDNDAETEPRPTSSATCPTSPQPESPMDIGGAATRPHEPVRPPQTFREHQPSLRSGQEGLAAHEAEKPHLGEHGYREMLSAALLAKVITTRERDQLRAIHDRIVPPDETDVIIDAARQVGS